ncbi:MAG: hypothetical protein DKT66_11385 [Candidatus Melainabacteria bacterium]|nr:MAG: hypothetical protein DKT66_11385 [Candidatus Melainabacteria bacterium]
MIAGVDLHERKNQLALIASAVLLAFVYGLYIGYSSRMLFNPSKSLYDGEFMDALVTFLNLVI